MFSGAFWRSILTILTGTILSTFNATIETIAVFLLTVGFGALTPLSLWTLDGHIFS